MQRGSGALQYLGLQHRSSPHSLQAAGVAKSLTQAAYINTATSAADRDNPSTEICRDLFFMKLLIDTNDNSPFQTFIGQIRSGPRHRTDVSWSSLGHPVYSMEVRAVCQRWDPGGSPRDPQELIRCSFPSSFLRSRCVRPADLKI